jgi:hypothetical protein
MPPERFDSMGIGRRIMPEVGYNLEQLWEDRENGNRTGIIRI